MVELWIPYGEVEVSVRVSGEKLAWTTDSRLAESRDNLDVARSALSSPLDSPRLNDLARPGSKLALVVSGFPGRRSAASVLQLLLDELYASGISPNEIEVIVARDNRPVNEALVAELSSSLKGSRLIVNDPMAEGFVDVGVTSFGTKVQLNRSFVGADLRIVVGEFHLNWFSGFVGGPWSIMPGISSHTTVTQNGKLVLRRDANTRPVEFRENTLQLDSREAASMIGVDFSLNILPDREGRVHAAFAGSFEKVLERSMDEADKLYVSEVPRKADILLIGAGGQPFDSSLLNACDAVLNVEETIEKDGRIVLVAECRDGPGDDIFLNLLHRSRDSRAALAEIRRDFSISGYKALRLLKLREDHRISLVSSLPNYIVRKFLDLRTANTANEGLRNAFRFLGRKSKIGVVGDGSLTVTAVTDES